MIYANSLINLKFKEMKIQTYISKFKDLSGGYNGQIDYNDTQIQVFAKTKKEVKRIINECKNAIKPCK